MLRRYYDMSGDYCELGPDIGLFTGFVAAAKHSGVFWLFEPNSNVHVALRSTLGGRSVNIETNMSDFSVIADNSIGACVMIHVLDHLFDPRDMITKLRTKLSQGGLLLIVTHDERSLMARLLRFRWPAYCLQHAQLFNRATTRALLESCGLRVVESRKAWSHFPATYLLKHFFFAIGLTKLASHIRGTSFSVPLKLGNIITLARRG